MEGNQFIPGARMKKTVCGLLNHHAKQMLKDCHPFFERCNCPGTPVCIRYDPIKESLAN
jgi:hypothetical protein